MINEYQAYEDYLRRLTEDQLIAELAKQQARENSYACSQAAHDAALFFGMMSYASSDAWMVTSCKKELARRKKGE